MSKHTPGPWTAIYPDKRYFHNGIDITMYEVMTVKTRAQLLEDGFTHYRSDTARVDNVSIVSNHFWKDMTADEAKANANLIAAAPDLLAALEQMLDAFLDTEGTHGAHEQDAMSAGYAAIAKAKGEA